MSFNRRRCSFGSSTRSMARRASLGLRLESLESRRVLATISGQVVNDLNGDGIIGAAEPGQSGVQVYIDANGNDQLDIVGTFAEPDNFTLGQAITAQGMTFQVVGSNNQPVTPASTVVAVTPDGVTSTGSHSFGREDGARNWNSLVRLRVNFATEVSGAAIDFIGARLGAGVSEIGVLRAYDSSGNLVAEDLTEDVFPGEYETLSVQLEDPVISYVVAYTQIPGAAGRLDALRVNSSGSEIWTLTDATGNYQFQNLPAGTHRINEVVPSGFVQTSPSGGDGSQQITVTADQVRTGVNFANNSQATNGWHNSAMAMDVTGDGVIAPRDVLLIINELNEPLYHDETGLLVAAPDPVPGFLDVDNDGFVTPTDAILIINFLNEQANAAAAARVAQADRAMASIAIGEPNGSMTETVSDGDVALAVLADEAKAKPVDVDPATVEWLFDFDR